MLAGLAPGTGMDQNAQGTGPTASQGLENVMGQIRAVGQSLQALGAAVPGFAADVQQMQQILKRLIVKAAQQAPQQQASAEQLPMGG